MSFHAARSKTATKYKEQSVKRKVVNLLNKLRSFNLNSSPLNDNVIALGGFLFLSLSAQFEGLFILKHIISIRLSV